MNIFVEFFRSLRVFKRLRLLEKNAIIAGRVIELHETKISALQNFIESREPCGACGHHRYRQKTLHRSNRA